MRIHIECGYKKNINDTVGRTAKHANLALNKIFLELGTNRPLKPSNKRKERTVEGHKNTASNLRRRSLAFLALFEGFGDPL